MKSKLVAAVGLPLLMFGVVTSCTPPPPAPGGPPPIVCYANTNPALGDLGWDGVNTPLGARLFNSTDGSCTPPALYKVTVVRAADLAAAENACSLAGAVGVETTIDLQDFGWPGLRNVWICDDQVPA
jgi:hypothetical protein